jgi:hypothetical protein
MQHGEATADGRRPGRDVAATLDDLQARLDRHFRSLRVDRDRSRVDTPVFALEHGLARGDLAVLNDSVRNWVRAYRPTRRLWLPFVVYATEIGYRYEGDEYWPTMASSTPGWERHGSRELVSRWFREFAEEFGGAVPRGRWASHFRIICWPITHAILPTDLQRQFARLLYDYRGALTAELLGDPGALGATLAARTSHTSKRFQQFAENIELLGHVAATLLSEGNGGGALLESTLQRIVADLSSERESRTWLGAAKRSAERVRMVGVGRGRPGSGGRVAVLFPVTGGTSAPVVFALQPTDAGWQLRLRVPDYAPLFARHPDVAEAVRGSRIVVAGFGGAPRPRGWLTHPGTELALDEWPGTDEPVFSLERAASRLNSILRDESRTPAFSPWLFRLGPDRSGTLVRSGAVHPGGTYVVLGPSVRPPGVDWAYPEPCAYGGLTAVRIEVPGSPSPSDLMHLRGLGCASLTDVTVEPVGIVPSNWDGEGYGEWLAGDEPLLMVSTSHPVMSCSLELDGRHTTVAQLASERRAFVHLTDVKPGSHRVRLSFLVDEGARPVHDAYVDVRIREPEASNQAGTFRDPLQIRSSPVTPTLEELWEDRCVVEIDGPQGVAVSIAFHLYETDGSTASHSVGPVPVPLDPAAFRNFFQRHLRGRAEIQRAYDDAVAGAIEVAEAELGTAALRLERAFSPLRWGFRRSQGRLALLLHDAADTGSLPSVQRYGFRQPDVGEPVVRGADGLFQHPEGGLFHARVDDYEASAVLPSPVRDFLDVKRVAARPRLQPRQRDVRDLLALLQVAQRWALAVTPGDPFARSAYLRVREAIIGVICGLVGGRLWASIEKRRGRGERVRIDRLESALGKPGDHESFRRKVRTIAANSWEGDVVERFGVALGEPVVRRESERLVVSRSHRAAPMPPGTRFTVGGRWLAEYLLRLGSDPGTILSWSVRDNRAILEELLATPIALRAARMIVLAAGDAREWTWD